MAASVLLSLAVLAHCAFAQAAPAATPHAKLSATVAAEAARAPFVDVLIVPQPRPPLDAATLPSPRELRLQTAARTLRASAHAAQRGIVPELAARGIAHRAFWIVNVIQARVPSGELDSLAARTDVARIVTNPRIRNALPTPEAGNAARTAKAVQANLSAVGADVVWALGFRGQGIVVAGQDTGYQWDHPALKASYRGWNGTGADHAYNWHDAIHTQVTLVANPCGYSSPTPCDDAGHGTHTMGIMVGDDGAGQQIGMAPEARWIGCRNMDRGIGTPATYIECFEWLLAPTDAAGANPDPTKAPHVINNSWACPPEEGCDAEHAALLLQAVENVRTAGILVVVSAGNSGPACNTIDDPPATSAASFVVGASSSNGAIADFSSRGSVLDDGVGRLKPDLVAPGVLIYSSERGEYVFHSGTSMAAPHVAGAAALVMSALPWVAGNPQFVEQVLREGAVPKTSAQGCGGFSSAATPNAVYGYGFLDVAQSLVVASTRVFVNDFE